MKKIKKLFICTLIMSLAASMGNISFASVLRNLDLEDATISSNWDIVDSGDTWVEKKLQHNAVETPFLSSYTPSGTGKSLKIAANSYTGTETLQRVEWKGNPQTPFNLLRYYGYQFCISNDSEIPTANNIITQFRQDGDSANPIGSLAIMGNKDNFYLMYVVLNTTYNLIDPNALGNQVNLVRDYPISKGVWHKVVIKFNPNGSIPGTQGNTALWIDGKLVVEYTGDIGYPANYLGRSIGTWPIVETYENAFGIYRPAQQTRQCLYFDNYKVGGYYADVAP